MKTLMRYYNLKMAKAGNCFVLVTVICACQFVQVDVCIETFLIHTHSYIGISNNFLMRKCILEICYIICA